VLRRADAQAPDAGEFEAAFAPWRDAALLLAVSGGPDSLALAAAAADWRARLPGPPLAAAIVDHALREGSRQEAETAAAQCRALGLPARILTWSGPKPNADLQNRAREARYRILAQAARDCGAGVIMIAHHADDQAETMMLRLLAGSGPAGLAGMAASSRREGLEIARPFLAFPKARLLAYVAQRGLSAAQDPSNADPRHARARLRALAPALAREGATPERFAVLARRLRRAEAALEAATDAAQAALARPQGCDAAGVFALPDEIRLRLLRRLVAAQGREPRLDRLEALDARLVAAFRDAKPARLTLAAALVELRGGALFARPAPPRRALAKPPGATMTPR
jgi:tRNA(Ile)-lysidine synthase